MKLLTLIAFITFFEVDVEQVLALNALSSIPKWCIFWTYNFILVLFYITVPIFRFFMYIHHQSINVNLSVCGCWLTWNAFVSRCVKSVVHRALLAFLCDQIEVRFVSWTRNTSVILDKWLINWTLLLSSGHIFFQSISWRSIWDKDLWFSCSVGFILFSSGSALMSSRIES